VNDPNPKILSRIVDANRLAPSLPYLMAELADMRQRTIARALLAIEERDPSKEQMHAELAVMLWLEVWATEVASARLTRRVRAGQEATKDLTPPAPPA
jgi:hypothetical protein